ncbi:unnamed protein product [Cochlearia groenlandica]
MVHKEWRSTRGLWFSLPQLLVDYVEERTIAISQLTAPCVWNLVAAMVVSKELGIEMTLRLFNEITRVTIFPSFYHFPPEYEPFKEAFRRRTKVLWTEILRQQKVSSRSYKLKPQKQKDIDVMLSLADLPGVFDDEIEAEFLAEEEEEERAADLEAGSPLAQTDLPPMPEGSPPATNCPPPPAGNPPAPKVVLPSPVDASPSCMRTSPYSVQMAGVKRAREEANKGSTGLPQATRLRTEAMPVEGRANVESDGQAVPDEEKVDEDQAVGLGSEGAGRSAMDTDLPKPDGEGLEPPLAEGDGFAHQLQEGNEHGFYFAYNGVVPFLNHKDASAGFQRAVYSAYHGEEGPTELVLAEEIAQLARLEQRVAFKRIHLSFTYETLLAEEKALAQGRLDDVEKEKDAALAKVKDLEKELVGAKKEKRSKRLKEKLEKVEKENADLKKKLEVEAESSRIRELALASSRKAEEDRAGELAALKENYDKLFNVSVEELARLRRSRFERLVAAKGRFDELHAASEARLGKLKAYLDEKKYSRD